jgi:predicted TIM-barrel fold metal-dependent hydrolase
MIHLVSRTRLARFAALAGITLALFLSAPAQIIDYHQHLYSPDAGARSTPGPKGITAETLIRELDAAGIERAVVLSVAYSFSNPNKSPVRDEYAHVMAENDWTSAQVAQYPDRLIAFCSVNPLRPYALREIARCAKDPNLRTGLKLHFGNSDVNLEDQQQLEMLRRVFRAANRYGMAITVHMHANVDHHRPYGAKQAQIFLEQLLPEAPNVTVQIAHLAGSGGYDDPTDQALSVFIQAIQRSDPRMKNVYFDVCSVALPGTPEEKSELIVKRIRQIGVERLLYGSDAATPDNLPRDALARWHQLPLTGEEFHRIDTNVAPFLTKCIAHTASSKSGQSPSAPK